MASETEELEFRVTLDDQALAAMQALRGPSNDCRISARAIAARAPGRSVPVNKPFAWPNEMIEPAECRISRSYGIRASV
jgi:hypothetical protein